MATKSDLANEELKGFDLIYQKLLDKHNALTALNPCTCDCLFCEDAGWKVNAENRPVKELGVCEACDELTDCDYYKEHMERAEQLRAIIKSEGDNQ